MGVSGVNNTYQAAAIHVYGSAEAGCWFARFDWRKRATTLLKTGVFLGEGEWKDSGIKGFAQAREYSTLPEASGSFLVIYPGEIRDKITKRRLTSVVPEELLSGVRFTGAFMRLDSPTSIKGKLLLPELGVQ